MLPIRVSEGWNVPLDKPGQTRTGRPVVPLSRDKKVSLSRCPFVPGQGQEQMSRDKLLCPGTSRDKMNLKIFKKKTRFPVLEHHFPVLEHRFPVLEHPFPVLEHPFLFQIIFFLS